MDATGLGFHHHFDGSLSPAWVYLRAEANGRLISRRRQTCLAAHSVVRYPLSDGADRDIQLRGLGSEGGVEAGLRLGEDIGR
jgi:hypothetical protein